MHGFANIKNCMYFIDSIGNNDTLKIKIYVNPETRINFNEELCFYRVDTSLFVNIKSVNSEIDTIVKVSTNVKQIARDFQQQILNGKIVHNKNLLHRSIFHYELSFKDIEISYISNQLFSFIEALDEVGIFSAPAREDLQPTSSE